MSLIDEFKNELKKTTTSQQVAGLKATYFSKKGKLAAKMQELKLAAIDKRQELGQSINAQKQQIQELMKDHLDKILRRDAEEKIEKEALDITLSSTEKAQSTFHGGVHPVTTVQRRLEEIFLSMGFDVIDGPHIETEHHNFTALNIPKDHPARDMQDTFWFGDLEHLLRTHTSSMQIHAMEKGKPPFRLIAPGVVFRNENVDASHDFCFHQMEGLIVQKGLGIGNLIYFMKTLLASVLSLEEVEIRLRPGYFPFVEPGFELDIQCIFCHGKGCSVCKSTGWTELVPCGLVHPNVLSGCNIDPAEYSGIAFGLGLDRLVMISQGIRDIRLLHSQDMRFLSQLRSF